MKTLLASNRLMIGTAVVVAIAGFGVSLALKEFMWFGRSGSLITFCGVILLTRPTIVRRDLLPDVTMTTGKSQLDPSHYAAVGEAVPERIIEDRKSRDAVGVYGPLLTMAGTLIWGFGDLLNATISK